MPGASTAVVQPGVVIAGFRLVEQIGSDGLGDLFRVQNVHAPKLARALRLIHPELAAQPEFRARLLHVAELLDALAHPNLLRLYHIGEEGETLFMVQELLVGRTLRALTAEQPMQRPVNVVADWIYQALCGLGHAHRYGIVHQDVSPESLFLTQTGFVKVIGFELVRLGEFMAPHRTTGRPEKAGAPSYFAPEFADGGAATALSDVYAMGLCLYEFLAGEPPYRAGGGTEAQANISLLLQHLTKPLPDLRQFRSDIPDGLLTVLAQATAKNPAERYQSADEFAAALRLYAEPEEAPAPAPPEAPPLAPPLLDRPPLIERAADPEPSAIELGWSDAGQPEPAVPRTRSSFEITAPQPALSEAPALEDHAVSVPASAKDSLAVKIRYLLLGALVSLAVIGGTAAGTAYFLRFALPLARPPAETTPQPGPQPGAAASPPPAAGQRPAAPSSPAEMVRIPAGTFRMGSRDGYPDERPDHVESVTAFFIDQHEVTVADYEKCVIAGECRKQKTIRQPDADHKFDRFCNYGRKSRELHPMNCVDWYQARAYCRWVGKRLPTEVEWEYAARSSDGRKYPWGNESPSESLLNACGRECIILGAQVGKKWDSMYAADDGWDSTAPVGSFPRDKSPLGVMDLAGNVAEWTDSEYTKCYRDDCEPSSKERVIRGGAWNDDAPEDVRASYRNRDVPVLRASFVGFRCARSDSGSAADTH